MYICIKCSKEYSEKPNECSCGRSEFELFADFAEEQQVSYRYEFCYSDRHYTLDADKFKKSIQALEHIRGVSGLDKQKDTQYGVKYKLQKLEVLPDTIDTAAEPVEICVIELSQKEAASLKQILDKKS